MNVGCVHYAISTSLNKGPGGNPSVLISDSGSKKTSIKEGKFDGQNILSHPHIGMFDIIIIKIQNAMRTMTTDTTDDFINKIESLMSFAIENNHKVCFIKPQASWNGNGENVYNSLFVHIIGK